MKWSEGGLCEGQGARPPALPCPVFLPSLLALVGDSPMAARSRMRPAHWIVLVLVAAPGWKVAERIWRPGPRAVSESVRAAGRELFHHEWAPGDPLAKGDGLGP